MREDSVLVAPDSKISVMLVSARPSQAGGDPIVQVAIRHHHGEHRHTRGVRRPSSLGEREQRRTGRYAVV